MKLLFPNIELRLDVKAKSGFVNLHLLVCPDDPNHVFDELVDLFVAAKLERQVIMVTHNANPVINTDADQIIVADAIPSGIGGLPTFTYTTGGLKDDAIRKAVCDILEGGEEAFRERARRLRVRLER